MDPTSAIAAGLTVVGSKDLLNKLLGPTADYLGNEARGLVAKCNLNLDNIFIKATKKLGERVNSPGTVSPRVLKHVYDEGRFCDDEISAEYYGGVLAASRSKNERDDRGVTVLATIKNLSVYQLRFHYIAYSTIHRLYRDQDCNFGDRNDCAKIKTFIPISVFVSAMDFQGNEDVGAILAHVLYGLGKHDLISSFYSGKPENLKSVMPQAPADGIIFSPTLLGSELFLWANGVSGASGKELLKVDGWSPISEITIAEGSMPVKKEK